MASKSLQGSAALEALPSMRNPATFYGKQVGNGVISQQQPKKTPMKAALVKPKGQRAHPQIQQASFHSVPMEEGGCCHIPLAQLRAGSRAVGCGARERVRSHPAPCFQHSSRIRFPQKTKQLCFPLHTQTQVCEGIKR